LVEAVTLGAKKMDLRVKPEGDEFDWANFAFFALV